MGWFDDVASELPEVRQYLGGPQDQQGPAVGADGWAMSNPGQMPQSQRPVQTPAQPSSNVGHNGTTPGGMTREAYRDAWMGSGAASMADLQKFIAQNGGTLLDGAGRVRTPYGEVIDMGINARGSAEGKGQMRAGWGATGADEVAVNRAAMQQRSGANNLYGGGKQSLDASILGDLDSEGNPIAQRLGSPRGLGLAPDGQAGAFKYDGPGPVAERIVAPEAFKGVSAADMAADPGYQFRLQEGQRAIENSRLAGGLGRTGDTAKELLNYGQQAASQEYGNVYGRKFGEHQSSLGAQMQAGMFNSQQGLAAQGQHFGQQHAAWRGNVDAELGRGNLNLGYTQAGNALELGRGQLALGGRQADNAYALGQGQLGLAQNEQSFNQGVMFPWQQQSTLAQMGLTAAQQSGAYGANYGANQGNAYYGQGNANAAGQVGAGNAWNSAYSGIANQAQDAWSQWYAGQKPRTQRPPAGGGINTGVPPVSGYGGG